MQKLFKAEDSESDDNLQINTNYASNYNSWRQKEELNKLKTKYGECADLNSSNESSDLSEEDEEGNELTSQFERDFYKTLSSLKAKDPKIYNGNVTFFESSKISLQNENDKGTKTKVKNKNGKDKPLCLRDYERNIILEHEGKYSDSDEEKNTKEKIHKSTYMDEQKNLKESFRMALLNEDQDDSILLIPKKKSEQQEQKEEEDYKEWLKGQETAINAQDQQELKPLKDFWTDPNLDKNEKFLRDYILNKKFLDQDNEDVDDDKWKDLSEDEENLIHQEEFEHKYNFRFEEPDQEFIKRYPRTMNNSMRKKDTRRSEKRAEIKKRKDEEKLRQLEELKKLKALKRKEIEDKIQQLKQITGNDDVRFDNIDLDADFDPLEHDRKMQELFNEDFYAGCEDNVKPEFPDIDEELGIESTWDNYNPNDEQIALTDDAYANGPHCEDPNFNMDADYDPLKSLKNEMVQSTGKKKRRRSKFAELIAKEKPKFDPNLYSSYQEYFDQYYALDYEDLIDDIPCRFKYRTVVPNDYGLTTEEILTADDKELNKWCSLRKALSHKPDHVEQNEVKVFREKAKNEALKRKIFRSMYSVDSEADVPEVNELNSKEKNAGKEDKIGLKRKRKHGDQNQTTDQVVHEIPAKKNHKEKLKRQECEESKKQLKEETKELFSDTTGLEAKLDPRENDRVDERSDENQKIRAKSRKSDITHNGNKDTLRKNTSSSKKRKQFRKKPTKNNLIQAERHKKGVKTKGESSNQPTELSAERLKAYGINPKKFKNKLKYGKK
ncbi:protein KRI1 homolog [Orussus abietinus]|uniref:protein KRI1 homolog n=1 Tax=Orussus abietinus TaxID=222816 RepID=UPI0006257E23|nr:protein KRI1 homolog [Orussus abietinus]